MVSSSDLSIDPGDSPLKSVPVGSATMASSRDLQSDTDYFPFESLPAGKCHAWHAAVYAPIHDCSSNFASPSTTLLEQTSKLKQRKAPFISPMCHSYALPGAPLVDFPPSHPVASLLASLKSADPFAQTFSHL